MSTLHAALRSLLTDARNHVGPAIVQVPRAPWDAVVAALAEEDVERLRMVQVVAQGGVPQAVVIHPPVEPAPIVQAPLAPSDAAAQRISFAAGQLALSRNIPIEEARRIVEEAEAQEPDPTALVPCHDCGTLTSADSPHCETAPETQTENAAAVSALAIEWCDGKPALKEEP